MIKRIIEFITEGIWQTKENDYKSRKMRWAVRQFKVVIFMARGLGEHNLAVRSAALTFYTLMSIVPIAALVFGVIKGFGMENSFNEYLYREYPQYTLIIDQIIDFANNMLIRARGGVIASVGFVVLLWSVMKVFGNVESAFNNIWEVRKARSITRKFSDYMAVGFVAPILWAISNSISIYLRRSLTDVAGSFWVDLLFGLASLVSIWIMFALIYRVMPNTKVRFRSALMAGVIAGTVFQLFQIGYFYIQSQVSSYNAIYGSFAALPLFLIWLQTSWQILLFGGELSFAYQNIDKYEQERQAMNMSYDHRRKVTVAVMLVAVRHFLKGEGPVSTEIVARQLDLPVRIVRDVIFDLEQCGMLVAVENERDERVNMYMPGHDVHAITVFDVVNCVEGHGESNIEWDQSPEMRKVNELVDGVRLCAVDSPSNRLLMDI